MANLERKIWRNSEWLYDHYYNKKLSYSQMSNIVGVSKRAMIFACKQFGIKSRSTSESLSAPMPTRKDLEKLYCTQQLSQSQISKIYGVSQSVVHKWMKKYGIKSRDHKNATQIRLGYGKKPLCEWANSQWLIEQYESKSVSEIASGVGWSTTFVHDTMAELGLEMRSNSEAMLMQSNKISKRMRDKWCDPEYRKFMLAKMAAYPKVSSLQTKLYGILDEMGIEYYREHNDKEDDVQCVIGYWHFDCVIPKHDAKNLIIECNGDYWHSLPEVVANDRRKSNYIYKYQNDAYDLKYLWEHDFANIDRVKQLIRYWVGLHKLDVIKFQFNMVNIRQINYVEAIKLLGAYHYIGTARKNSKNYGAFLGDELIAVGSFGPITRKQSADRLELKYDELIEYTRLCIHPSYQKKNFATWLTAKFIKKIRNDFQNAKAIIAFADLSHNHVGTIYKAGNWEFNGVVPPSYWYLDVDGFVWHKKTVYNKAVKSDMKESEFACQNELSKIYGKEKYRYIYWLRLY